MQSKNKPARRKATRRRTSVRKTARRKAAQRRTGYHLLGLFRWVVMFGLISLFSMFIPSEVMVALLTSQVRPHEDCWLERPREK